MSRLLFAVVAALLALTGPTASAQEPAQIEVEVVGRPVVGQPVTAIVAVDQPGSTAYQWTRAYNHSGTPLDFPGATQQTFTPTAYFRGKLLGLRVTHTSPSGETTQVVRLVGLVRAGELRPVRVKVRGTVAPGRVLRAVVTRPADPPPGYQLSFQWYAGGQVVRVDGKPATTRRLRLGAGLLADHRGERLHVRVTAAAPGYRPGVARSEPTSRL